MQLRRDFARAALVVALYVVGSACVAQTKFTDSKTGITFGTWSISPSPNDAKPQAPYTFGMVLPPDATAKDATEYIGYLRCTSAGPGDQGGWCGVSHGAAGQMTQALLIVAWPYNGQVLTSFRFATAYKLPEVYTGNAVLTQISSSVNATNYELIYRCQNCFAWNQAGSTGNVSSSAGSFVIGRAQARSLPTNPGCPDKISFGYHNSGFGQYGAALAGVVNPSYSAWAALATKAVTTNCGAAGPASPTAAPTSAAPTGPTVPVLTPTTITTVVSVTTPASSAAAPSSTTVAAPKPSAECESDRSSQTYDYIIAGGGAGGIPIADRLSRAGHKVLLIEKGPPSTGRWGGTMKPAWLEGEQLTRFDVPGLCNQIWVDSIGVACTDTDQMAGCVLGGGTAVNAGLWWKPNPLDWDYNFPAGWKSNDVAAATDRVFQRIPGTTTPSMDGKAYLHEGFNVLSTGLAQGGWTKLDQPNSRPTQKNHTFGPTSYMFSGGERGGPLATYLVTASQRRSFTLWTNTAVKRVIRTGGHVTGVEVESTGAGGKCGTVKVTNYRGRVVVSAGTFGSAKILLRSGIGPADQLAVVKSSTDGPTLIAQDQWINLPVGYNLVDHVNTDVVVEHPDVVFYDFYEAWTDPNITDALSYLRRRSGILAQSAPNIGPMMWDEILGKDGIVRQLQWTSRVEGSMNVESKYAMTMSQYLGRGSTSRGRMAISKTLDTVVAQHPYLRDPNDLEAVIQGIHNMQNALKGVVNLTWASPLSNTTIDAYVAGIPVGPGARRANHWMGTNKLGSDDGRTGGTSVVDLNTKVYGTDNLFVVDASIFPGMSTGNPSAMIVIASEYAADRILALPIPTGGVLGDTCGGKNWKGAMTCAPGLDCHKWSDDVSTCVAPAGSEADYERKKAEAEAEAAAEAAANALAQ